jgi:hypothetical protein
MGGRRDWPPGMGQGTMHKGPGPRRGAAWGGRVPPRAPRGGGVGWQQKLGAGHAKGRAGSRWVARACAGLRWDLAGSAGRAGGGPLVARSGTAARCTKVRASWGDAAAGFDQVLTGAARTARLPQPGRAAGEQRGGGARGERGPGRPRAPSGSEPGRKGRGAKTRAGFEGCWGGWPWRPRAPAPGYVRGGDGVRGTGERGRWCRGEGGVLSAHVSSLGRTSRDLGLATRAHTRNDVREARRPPVSIGPAAKPGPPRQDRRAHRVGQGGGVLDATPKPFRAGRRGGGAAGRQRGGGAARGRRIAPTAARRAGENWGRPRAASLARHPPAPCHPRRRRR